jgi:hypothetical protein
MIGKSGPAIMIIGLLATTALLPSAAYASCVEFEKEAEAIEGAVPKFDENGKLRAIVMYADASFLAPKRSLISKARRKAELKAKRAFSAWMEENLGSETLATDMMEQEEVTDQDGNTQGSVRELETQINIMRSDTKSVLSGLVKLDECVDTGQKFVLVELGWKPSLSKAAADTKQKIKSEVKRGNKGTRATDTDNRKSSKITRTTGYRKKSTLKDDF